MIADEPHGERAQVCRCPQIASFVALSLLEPGPVSEHASTAHGAADYEGRRTGLTAWPPGRADAPRRAATAAARVTLSQIAGVDDCVSPALHRLAVERDLYRNVN